MAEFVNFIGLTLLLLVFIPELPLAGI